MGRSLSAIWQGLCRLCGAAIGLWLGAVVCAFAADSSPRIGYFETTDGQIGFVLDLSRERARQRFNGSPEILVLRAQPAPSGNTLYRLPDGRVHLRVTPFGAVTYFPPGNEIGLAAARVSDATPLAPVDRTPEQVIRLLRTVTARLSWVHGVTIPVDATLPARSDAADLRVLGDAIENLGIALELLLANPANWTDFRQGVTEIHFVRHPSNGLSLEAPVLTIYYTPERGLLGRPSSLEISAFVSKAFADIETFELGQDDEFPGPQPGGASSNPLNSNDGATVQPIKE